jgi:hypothetical protein
MMLKYKMNYVIIPIIVSLNHVKHIMFVYVCMCIYMYIYRQDLVSMFELRGMYGLLLFKHKLILAQRKYFGNMSRRKISIFFTDCVTKKLET